MLKAVELVFDGKNFVPTAPVDLPTGTKVTVELPDPDRRVGSENSAAQPAVELPDHGYPGPRAGAPDPNNPPTPEEEAVWLAFMRAIRSAPPDPPTFDEYLRRRREGL